MVAAIKSDAVVGSTSLLYCDHHEEQCRYDGVGISDSTTAAQPAQPVGHFDSVATDQHYYIFFGDVLLSDCLQTFELLSSTALYMVLHHCATRMHMHSVNYV